MWLMDRLISDTNGKELAIPKISAPALRIAGGEGRAQGLKTGLLQAALAAQPLVLLQPQGSELRPAPQAIGTQWSPFSSGLPKD